MIVFTLLLVVLTSDGTVTTSSRNYPTADECEMAAEAARDAAALAFDILDVGTVCVKSDFSKELKPRA